jgi:hypothetical protein
MYVNCILHLENTIKKEVLKIGTITHHIRVGKCIVLMTQRRHY